MKQVLIQAFLCCSCQLSYYHCSMFICIANADNINWTSFHKNYVLLGYYAVRSGKLLPFLCYYEISSGKLLPLLTVGCEPCSSVGVVTELRAGRSGIEYWWCRDFPPVQIGPGAHPASCKMGTGSFLGVKCGRGVLLTTHPLLVPRSWKGRGVPLPTLWATPDL